MPPCNYGENMSINIDFISNFYYSIQKVFSFIKTMAIIIQLCKLVNLLTLYVLNLSEGA